MSVIVELALPATAFQLGRILSTEGDTTIRLETMVPLGGRSVPFFRVVGPARGFSPAQVRQHSVVSDLHVVETYNSETLYAMDWEISDHTFLEYVVSLDGAILEASGGPDRWLFRLRFPSHSALSAFQDASSGADIPIDIKRIYNPTTPDGEPWYGLTTPQRNTLVYAVENGYYSLPRKKSTQAIAEAFDISDQAASERLRRAIDTLVRNTLMLTDSDDPD